MNISEFCIRHPVATTLMSIALVAGGMFGYLFLPVAALPRVEFPVIKDTESLNRKHVLRAGVATIVDKALVNDVIAKQRQKIDEAAGVQALPLGDEGEPD